MTGIKHNLLMKLLTKSMFKKNLYERYPRDN